MVKLEVSKKDFVWIGLFVILISIGFGIAQWDSAKAMFHSADDVKVAIDSVDYNLQEALDGGLIGGGMKFGDWQNFGTSTGTHVATTDGFVVAWGNGGHCGGGVLGYTDSDSSSLVEMQRSGSGYVDTAHGGSITMPVRAGDSWKVGTTGCMSLIAIYWIPIVSSGGSGGDSYISDWKSISTGGNVVFDHDLGTDAIETTLQFKPTSDGVVSVAHTSDFAGSGYGVGIYEVSDSQIKVGGGSADLRYWVSGGNTGSATPSSGFVRVIARVV